MQEESPRLIVSEQAGVTLVKLAERKILDEMSIAQIGEELLALVEGDKPKLVLDFASVAHMSSAALGMLITLHKRVRERGGQLRLCSIQPSIYEIFVITRLNEIFRIHESVHDALASIE